MVTKLNRKFCYLHTEFRWHPELFKLYMCNQKHYTSEAKRLFISHFPKAAGEQLILVAQKQLSKNRGMGGRRRQRVEREERRREWDTKAVWSHYVDFFFFLSSSAKQKHPGTNEDHSLLSFSFAPQSFFISKADDFHSTADASFARNLCVCIFLIDSNWIQSQALLQVLRKSSSLNNTSTYELQLRSVLACVLQMQINTQSICACMHLDKDTYTTKLYTHTHTQTLAGVAILYHLSLVINASHPNLGTNAHRPTCTEAYPCAQATAQRAVGCNQTLHLYVHHVHWEKCWDKENKHAHMHARIDTHTLLHTEAHTHTKSNTLRHALWSTSVDQNSFLSAFSPPNQYPRRSTDSRKCAKEALLPSHPPHMRTHAHTHIHRHTHGCWCVMASAASLLTPHMLTEAYTSLLAALTIWHPTERHSHKLDLDRQARDGSKDKEVQWSDQYKINVT